MRIPDRLEAASQVLVSVHIHRGAGKETENHWCRMTRVPTKGEYVSLDGVQGLCEIHTVVHVAGAGDSDAEVYALEVPESAAIGRFVRGE